MFSSVFFLLNREHLIVSNVFIIKIHSAKVKAEDVPARVETLLEELRMARNEISAIRAKAAVHRASIIANNVLLVGNSNNIK